MDARYERFDSAPFCISFCRYVLSVKGVTYVTFNMAGVVIQWNQRLRVMERNLISWPPLHTLSTAIPVSNQRIVSMFLLLNAKHSNHSNGDGADNLPFKPWTETNRSGRKKSPEEGSLLKVLPHFKPRQAQHRERTVSAGHKNKCSSPLKALHPVPSRLPSRFS